MKFEGQLNDEKTFEKIYQKYLAKIIIINNPEGSGSIRGQSDEFSNQLCSYLNNQGFSLIEIKDQNNN